MRLNPRKAPMNVRGREIPNHRHRRASKVVKGMAALDPAPHRNRLITKKMTKTTPGMSRALISMLIFQRSPPITNGHVSIM